MTSFFIAVKKFPIILENIKHDLKRMLLWLKMNFLQANPRKFQFMILMKKKCDILNLKKNSIEFKESKKVTLLGVIIDNKLTFNEYIRNLLSSKTFVEYI